MNHQANTVYSLALSYVTAKVLALAGEYELDHLITEDGIKISVLTDKLSLNEAALFRFLRVLDAHGVILIVDDKVYRTPLTEQLADIRSPHLTKAYEAFEEIEHTLKTHQPAWNKKFGKDFYSTLNQGELNQFADWCRRTGESWMTGLLKFYDFSRYQRIVDIAGGQGHFLAELLKRHPWQSGILFDQPEVVKTAEPVLSSYHCLNRVEVIGGDFFQSIPESGDLYTICRTLLNWNDEDAIKILNVCAKHLPKTAKLLIIDFILPDKSHPHYLRTVLSDFNLLIDWNSGNRTEAEWIELVNQSDLTLENIIISNDSITPVPFAPMILLECCRG